MEQLFREVEILTKKPQKRLFNIQNISLAGIMLALTIIIVKFVNFPLKVGVGGKGSMIIGFGFVPLVIFGFINGALFGFIFGIIVDTTLYILHPGLYSPIMALQKPLVGLLAGFMGVGYMKISSTHFKIKNYLIFFIIMQFILITVAGLSFRAILINNFYSFGEKSLKLFANKWSLIYKALFASFIAILLITIEAALIVILKKIKSSKNSFYKPEKFNNYLIFILIVMLQLMLTVINSWFLTPMHYLIFFKVPYGISLLPRLVKELVLMPFRILIYFIVLKAVLKVYYQRYSNRQLNRKGF